MIKSKTQLAIELSRLQTFLSPKSELEQYTIDSEIAASILWSCSMNGILGTVADLGAGTGILGLGAALLGSKRVYLIEKDPKALEIAQENQKNLEKRYGKLPISYINKDIADFNTKVDTVIMNPPFGVQKEHADRLFLEKAFQIADNTYTLHKIESKGFIDNFAKDSGFTVKEVIEFDFPLKASMGFHKQKVRKIRVGCWVLFKPGVSRIGDIDTNKTNQNS